MALADYINNKPVIETNRLILRPMIVSDIAALKKRMPDKSIYTYWGKSPGCDQTIKREPWQGLWNRGSVSYDKILF